MSVSLNWILGYPIAAIRKVESVAHPPTPGIPWDQFLGSWEEKDFHDSTKIFAFIAVLTFPLIVQKQSWGKQRLP